MCAACSVCAHWYCTAGGTSLLTQLRERLERELLEGAPPTAKVKITCPSNSVERRCNVWIGEPSNARGRFSGSKVQGSEIRLSWMLT